MVNRTAIYRRRVIEISLVLAFSSVVPVCASADPVSQPITLEGASAQWQSVSGQRVNDAALIGTTQSDAFDNALVTSVNGTEYIAANPAERSNTADGQFLDTGPTTIHGLSVSKHYFAHALSNTLRTLLSMTNPTGGTLGVVVQLQTNVGSDGSTQIIASSSGDANFTTADRYLITDDSSTTTSDPANTHVLFGPSLPRVTPSAVDSNVFENAGMQGVEAFYNLTVPSGQTRSLLFFNQIHATAVDAQSNATVFDSKSALASSGLLAGLSVQQLVSTVNFEFGLPDLSGDYNLNGRVDAADYAAWRDTQGQELVGPNLLAADGSQSGVIDFDDYNFWKSQFGHTAGASSAIDLSSDVPEPTSLLLLALALLPAWACARHHFPFALISTVI